MSLLARLRRAVPGETKSRPEIFLTYCRAPTTSYKDIFQGKGEDGWVDELKKNKKINNIEKMKKHKKQKEEKSQE